MRGKRAERRVWVGLVAGLGVVAVLGSGCAYLAPASVTTGTSDVGNGFSREPAISSSGRYVAYTSTSSNLVANDTNVAADVFVHDNATNATERVSVATAGTEGNGESNHPAVSADGRYVAFESAATNLVANDTNAVDDVFVRDRIAHTTARVSVSAAGVQANGGSAKPSISADGSLVAFQSDATNLASSQFTTTPDRSEIYTRRWAANPTTGMVSAKGCILQSGSIIEANDGSFDPTISGDGKWIAFTSSATDLVSVDVNAGPDVFVAPALQLCGNWQTAMVDVDGNGSNANSIAVYHTISFDGRFVAYRGWNGVPSLVRIVRRDRTLGTDAFFDSPSFPGDPVSLSADGRVLAFTRQAGGGQYEAYVHDFATATDTLASTTSQLVPGFSLADADAPALMAANGDYVAFTRDDAQVVTRFVTVPTIAGVAPGTVTRGTTGTLWITGTNFRPGSRVYSDTSLLTIGPVTYLNPSLLLASYSAAAQAPIRTIASIYVALPDGFAPFTSAAARCLGCVALT